MNTLRSRVLGIVGVTAAVAISTAWTTTASAQEHGSPHWAYEGAGGPSNWADLNPAYAVCKSGNRQSPIDIRNATPSDLPAIQFNYQAMALNIIDNGHTIQINAAPGSFILVGGHRYDLKQYHFHLPSEEAINGKHFAMVAHLVHADSAGKLAVVGVLLTQGADNSVIQQLWQNLPPTKEKALVRDNVQVDPSGLLPADRGYYTYAGSLTTPPCSEHVTWFVLKQQEPISAAEVAQFRAIYPDNARPIQPTNDRRMQVSK